MRARRLANLAQRVFSVPVGSTVRVKSSVDAARLSFRVWDQHESVEVTGASAARQLEKSGRLLELVHKSEDASVGTLEARIPARFCSVDVDGSGVGGQVYVEGVREGGLRVRLNGGDVELGTIKSGALVQIETSGGSVSGRSIQGSVELRTGGGDVGLRQILADTLQVSSQGGDVEVESVFCRDVAVDGGGGNVKLSAVNAQDGCGTVSTSGDGRVDVGVDGRVDVSGESGPVHVHLSAAARRVRITAGRGPVTCSVSSELSVVGTLRGASEVAWEGDLCVEERPVGDGAQRAVLLRGSAWTSSARGPPCILEVSTSGPVQFRETSWLERVGVR